MSKLALNIGRFASNWTVSVEKGINSGNHRAKVRKKLWLPILIIVRCNQINGFFYSPFPIHRTYFWVSPPQMALLGFFHSNSLFASPVHSRKTWIHRPTGIVREREVTWWGKKKKEEEKSPEKNHFAMTGIWTHGLCIQSQACYPLGHGALPQKEIRT